MFHSENTLERLRHTNLFNYFFRSIFNHNLRTIKPQLYNIKKYFSMILNHVAAKKSIFLTLICVLSYLNLYHPLTWDLRKSELPSLIIIINTQLLKYEFTHDRLYTLCAIDTHVPIIIRLKSLCKGSMACKKFFLPLAIISFSLKAPRVEIDLDKTP